MGATPPKLPSLPDLGCELYSSCLTCPLPACIEDIPPAHRQRFITVAREWLAAECPLLPLRLGFTRVYPTMWCSGGHRRRQSTHLHLDEFPHRAHTRIPYWCCVVEDVMWTRVERIFIWVAKALLIVVVAALAAEVCGPSAAI